MSFVISLNKLNPMKNQKLENLSQFLSYDAEVELALSNLEAQALVDDTLMADYVDDVQMTEQFEFTFTVRDLLEHIS